MICWRGFIDSSSEFSTFSRNSSTLRTVQPELAVKETSWFHNRDMFVEVTVSKLVSESFFKLAIVIPAHPLFHLNDFYSLAVHRMSSLLTV